MRLLLAKTAGFCMGVSRAVEMVLDASNRNEGPICTYGPLIHNPQVLKTLEDKGVPAITDIPEKGSGTVLLRAHGVPPSAKEKLKAAGFKIIDATCPRVIKVQTIIRKHARKGYACIIIGDRDHPEVIGLHGYAGDNGYVVNTIEDLDALPAFEKAIIVAQTTQNTLFYEEVKQWAAKRYPHYTIFDTICDSTEKRQDEIYHLAQSADAVVVVGGRNSGNTRRLVEVARQAGKDAYHVEDESELDLETLAIADTIAITAGASTPNWIIKKVCRKLETALTSKDTGWHRYLAAIQHPLLLTNIYLSLGAGCLCYACNTLQNVSHNLQTTLIAMLYILSMQIFNHLAGIRSDRYNAPERAEFYDKNMPFLTLLAIAAGGLGLYTAYIQGFFSFMILFIMSLLGLSYKLQAIPSALFEGRYRSLKEIPGSKTVLIMLAWGIVTVILPAFSEGRFKLATPLAFAFAAAMVFVRTAFFNVIDMQGDRIVGKETLPILLGEKKTLELLKKVLISLIILLPFSSLIHLTSGIGTVLAVCPAALLAILIIHEKECLLSGIKLEFMVESIFIVAGFVALIWNFF